jgi:hypothetical protein
MGGQTFIVRLDSSIARRLRSFLAGDAHGYGSLDEFVEVALENQLGLENAEIGSDRTPPTASARDAEARPPSGGKTRQVTDELAHLKGLLDRPAASPSIATADEGPRRGTLSPFTNRLSPIKVAARVRANIAAGEAAWPDIVRFREDSAEVARYLGKRLREADGSAPIVRRWVAYPIGAEPDKAKARFANSFTVSADGTLTGPMITLGLANISGSQVALTRAGWRLAAAPSPLVDGSDGTTLSPPEAEILRAQLKQSPDEIEAVREFLRLVHQSRGKQEQLDELLAEDHRQWTKEVLVAQRSAMLGRLSDLAVLEVTGRGLSATIQLLSAAGQLEANVAR